MPVKSKLAPPLLKDYVQQIWSQGTPDVRLSDLLKPERISVPIRATDKRSVLTELLGLLVGTGQPEFLDILRSVEEREQVERVDPETDDGLVGIEAGCVDVEGRGDAGEKAVEDLAWRRARAGGGRAPAFFERATGARNGACPQRRPPTLCRRHRPPRAGQAARGPRPGWACRPWFQEPMPTCGLA